jgi:uncharacterized protein
LITDLAKLLIDAMDKKSFLPKSIALLTVLLFCITARSIFPQETKPFSVNESPLPAPTAPVNDYVGVLDEGTKQQLNKKIIDFKARTNPPVELAVAIVNTTGGRDLDEYSLAIYRGWKIGAAADDSPGALLLIATDDRKYFTQVGYDLEDELPDSLAGQLQRQYLVPALKQGDYNKGVSDTIDAYIRTIEAKQSGTATPTPDPAGKTTVQKKGRGFSLCGIAPCLIILLIILIAIFSRSGKRDKNDRDRWGGGGFGGGGGSALPWLIIGSILGSGSSSSSSGGWGGGGGSSWGGGGGGWGGFGGGGGAGGGGAGGSW